MKLKAEMGYDVWVHLRQFTELPEHGFMAGQAVASAVSELFGDGLAVWYSDVDVFREYTREERAALGDFKMHFVGPRRPPRALNTVSFNTTELIEEYGEINEAAIGRYRVLSTARNGMLNEVFCSFDTHSRKKFLQTFDLNCVQVGVDLATKELFWSPEFEVFHQTRQMAIVSLHTPYQSLIRYFRKKNQLKGVFGNDERMIQLIGAAYKVACSRQEGLKEYNDLRWSFGQMYLERFESVADKILPHFELETSLKNDYPVHVLVPKFEPDERLVSAVDIGGVPHLLPRVSQAFHEKHKKAKQERLEYLIDAEKSLTRITWLRVGDSFVRGNVTPAQMEKIDKLAREHAIKEHIEADTLTEQWSNFSQIQAEVAKRGMWVYGVLENRSKIPTAEALSALLDEQFKLMGEKLAPAILDKLEFEGYVATELTTGAELMTEGKELHHCVAGYADKVKNGRSRIISIRATPDPQYWLTLELFRQGGFWDTVQCRGLQNRITTKEEAKWVRQYVNLFNLAEVAGAPFAKILVKRSPIVARFASSTLMLWKSLRAQKLIVSNKGLSNKLSLWLHSALGTPWYVQTKDCRWLHPTLDMHAYWYLIFVGYIKERLGKLVTVFQSEAVLSGETVTDIRSFYDEDQDIPF